MKGTIVILDATSSIGRAVVQAAVSAGRPVVAVSPDASALARLRAVHAGADLTLITGSASDEAGGAQLAAHLRELGRPFAGVIVASCREPARGRLLDQSSDRLRRTLNDELLPHFICARELVPLLADAGRNGGYVVIGGPGSDQPWAGYGSRSVAAAATRMLLRVLHDEARTLGVRVQLLAVDMPARTDDNVEHACAQWPSATAIGERALALIDQTDTRVSAEAVVRFAAQLNPPSARRPAPPPPPSPPASTTDPILDATWALLKPLLSTDSKKATTS
jgi:NAD(P)-dependent dehydrogenase (short-subunit alcohol dehydrogenase family)